MRQVGKRAVESLIKVGALDGLGARASFASALDRIMVYSTEYHKIKETGQMSMFGGASDTATPDGELLENLPLDPSVTPRQMLDWERELLGIFLSQHPVDAAMGAMRGSSLTTHDLLETPNGKAIRLIGLIAAIRKIATKNKEMMAIATLEDRFGKVEVVLFPRTWKQYEALMIENKVVVVIGKYDTSRGDPQIVCDAVTTNVADLVAADDAPYARPTKPTNGAHPTAASAPPEPRYNEPDPPAAAFVSPDEPPDLPPFDPTEAPPDDSAYLPAEVYSPYMPPDAPTNGAADAAIYTHDAADAAPPPRTPQTLKIAFTLYDDEAHNTRRRERMVGYLTEHPGIDRVEIYLLHDDKPTHRVVWKGTADYASALIDKLNKMDDVRVMES